MKRIISAILVLSVFVTIFAGFNVSAATTYEEKLPENEFWDVNWSSDVKSVSCELYVEKTGLYNFVIRDHNQTGYFLILISDITSSEIVTYLYSSNIEREYISEQKLLKAGHVYQVQCAYIVNLNSSKVEYLDANMSIKFISNDQGVDTLPDIDVNSSNLSINFTQYNPYAWLKYKTSVAGDYSFNFTDLKAYVYLYNMKTGELIDARDTQFMSQSGRINRNSLVYTLEAATEYYFYILPYEASVTKLSLTKNVKNINILSINCVIRDVDCFWDSDDIDETCFDYLVWYSDSTYEIADSYDIAMAGYETPWIQYEGEKITINDSEYLRGGEQRVTCTFGGKTTETTIFIKPLTEFFSSLKTYIQDETMTVSYTTSKKETRYWKIKVNESGYYSLWSSRYSGFEFCFKDYSVKIVDDTNNIIEYDYQKLGWPIVADKEYVMVLSYQYEEALKERDVLFYIHKDYDLENDPARQNGWFKIDGDWYYYLSGQKVKNEWMKDSYGWCYLGKDGKMVTNKWVQDSAGWCYVGSDGYCLVNQWMKDIYGWCYLGSNGRMIKNQWIKDSVGWCYLDKNGYCLTNAWMKDSVGWCYLDKDGRMATNKWIKDSVGWCYLDKNGYCLTNAWMKDSIGWCYLGSDGRMVTNGYVYDSKGKCWLDKNGYWNGIYY